MSERRLGRLTAEDNHDGHRVSVTNASQQGLFEFMGDRLHTRFGDVDAIIGLSAPESAFLGYLFKRVNEPVMSAELVDMYEHVYPGCKPNNVYKAINKKLPEVAMRHVIDFGLGKGKWYAALTDADDISGVLESGRSKVEATKGTNTDNQQAKRLKVFDDLEDIYSGENPDRFSWKKVAGVAGVAFLGVGGAVVYKLHGK